MANSKPITPKEFADMIGRSPRWVRAQCKAKKIPTLPPHRQPYLIPPAVLFKLGMEATK
jgi:hypothetical protein